MLLADKRPYFNPTRELIINHLASLPHVTLHGPGYCSTETHIKTLALKYGHFDLIICDSVYFYGYGTPKGRIYNPNNELKWPQDLFLYDSPLLVINLLDDVHGYSSETIERFVTNRVFLLSTATSKQFFKKLDAEDYERESFLHYPNYAFENPEFINDRYLFLPHCVDETEILPINPHPKYDVSILGVEYFFRKMARAKLITSNKHNSLAIKHNDSLQRIIRFLVGKTNIGSSIYRRRFIRIINDSFCSITCSGTVGYPIRKFFEIPAYGSLLMADFFKEPQSLGYVNGENCVYLDINMLEDLASIVENIITDKHHYLKVIRNGQDMIREFHTVQKRVQQIMDIAQSIASNKLITTHWVKGQQVLELKGHVPGSSHDIN